MGSALKPIRRNSLVAVRKTVRFTQEELAAHIGVERSTGLPLGVGRTTPLPASGVLIPGPRAAAGGHRSAGQRCA